LIDWFCAYLEIVYISAIKIPIFYNQLVINLRVLSNKKNKGFKERNI